MDNSVSLLVPDGELWVRLDEQGEVVSELDSEDEIAAGLTGVVSPRVAMVRCLRWQLARATDRQARMAELVHEYRCTADGPLAHATSKAWLECGYWRGFEQLNRALKCARWVAEPRLSGNGDEGEHWRRSTINLLAVMLVADAHWGIGSAYVRRPMGWITRSLERDKFRHMAEQLASFSEDGEQVWELADGLASRPPREWATVCEIASHCWASVIVAGSVVWRE